jgi:hypothetical protein
MGCNGPGCQSRLDVVHQLRNTRMFLLHSPDLFCEKRYATVQLGPKEIVFCHVVVMQCRQYVGDMVCYSSFALSMAVLALVNQTRS